MLYLSKKMRGFTLIEMMVTLIVLSILMTTAYVSYAGFIQKSRRTDAIAGLMNVRSCLERCYTDSNTYVGCFTACDISESPDAFYTLSEGSASVVQYTLIATAKGSQLADSDCPTLTVSEAGDKTSNSATNDAKYCWGRH